MYYDRDVDYSVALNNAHQAFMTRFKNIGTTKKAQELENILREIKIFSSKMNNLSDNDPVYQSLKEQYFDLIEMTTSILNSRRSKPSFKSSRLFNRAHYNSKTKSGTKAVGADDIFEEELAALISATEFFSTGQFSADFPLMGQTFQSSKAIDYAFDKKLDDSINTILKELAGKMGRAYESSNPELQIRAGKIDVGGLSASLEITQSIPDSVYRLAQLLKGANFTVKNYSSFTRDISGNISTKDLADINIHLGNSNLYKAITGAMSELGLGSRQLQNFFYRGATTIFNNSHGYGDEVQEHWAHMRLIYELRGSGLLDANGHVITADYIIWNDPNSENIAVASTATLLYNLLNSSNMRKSLFGDVQISGLQVTKGKQRIG